MSNVALTVALSKRKPCAKRNGHTTLGDEADDLIGLIAACLLIFALVSGL